MKNPYKLLSDNGFNIRYGHYTDDDKFPLLIYLGAGSNNVLADNKVYHSDNLYQLELCYLEKDEELEEKLEKVLNDNEIIWDKSEDVYIDTENFYVIYYELG